MSHLTQVNVVIEIVWNKPNSSKNIYNLPQSIALVSINDQFFDREMSEEMKFKPKKVKNLRARRQSSDEDEETNREDEEVL